VVIRIAVLNEMQCTVISNAYRWSTHYRYATGWCGVTRCGASVATDHTASILQQTSTTITGVCKCFCVYWPDSKLRHDYRG